VRPAETSGTITSRFGFHPAEAVTNGSNYIVIRWDGSGSPLLGKYDLLLEAGGTGPCVHHGHSRHPAGLSNAVPVLIDGVNQLGAINSSRRCKEVIQDMGAASDGLIPLRPVPGPLWNLHGSLTTSSCGRRYPEID
jgi:hypothetical protein